MLEGLIYLYGDMMDLCFEYGVLNITVCAFAFSIYLHTIKPPSDPHCSASAFAWPPSSTQTSCRKG
jgi:hypothetical protein